MFVLWCSMPKISDEARADRRKQILEAAWRCFQRDGLHATSMHDIIRASGLSAGAVYSYFKSKEDLIFAAVTTSLSGLGELLNTVLRENARRPLEDLAEQIMLAIDGFTQRQGYDLRRLALLGWSEAQRNERLRTTMEAHYREFRDRLSVAIGSRSPGADASAVDAMAKTLLSVVLGTVVQSAILGDVPPSDVASGLRNLVRMVNDSVSRKG